MPEKKGDSMKHHASSPKIVGTKNGKVRVTLIIPYELDRNIEAYSVKEGLLKTEVVTRALHVYLQSQGLKPDKSPKVSVSY